MKITSALILSLTCTQLYACNNNANEPVINSTMTANTDTMKLKIKIGTKIFTASLENNATANAFKSILPITLNMIELNGNEKYANLSGSLTTKASNPGAIHAGDLMLYGSSTLVLFYKTFSTSYTYTRLGRIDDVTGLAAAVGSGNVMTTFEFK